MEKYETLLKEAIKYYWQKRAEQNKKQGEKTGVKDAGNRSAVTGGAHLDGFLELIKTVLRDFRLPDTSVFCKKTALPGFFRPTKEWDLIVVHKEELAVSIEFKSQVGPSFGNNFNNRV